MQIYYATWRYATLHYTTLIASNYTTLHQLHYNYNYNNNYYNYNYNYYNYYN